ncbi:hypothetical protein RRG08_015315 [Elysia crispata]|uniref:Uncharacterized protein n=1 Tax=Elysia crispata TaxID=231223 RepID=A0AAE1A7D4_9GAST|nr:hypothetical protein RRG08_015315 [Elysia crispata]
MTKDMGDQVNVIWIWTVLSLHSFYKCPLERALLDNIYREERSRLLYGGRRVTDLGRKRSQKFTTLSQLAAKDHRHRNHCSIRTVQDMGSFPLFKRQFRVLSICLRCVGQLRCLALTFL